MIEFIKVHCTLPTGNKSNALKTGMRYIFNGIRLKVYCMKGPFISHRASEVTEFVK